jgi:hypothetical protein
LDYLFLPRGGGDRWRGLKISAILKLGLFEFPVELIYNQFFISINLVLYLGFPEKVVDPAKFGA